MHVEAATARAAVSAGLPLAKMYPTAHAAPPAKQTNPLHNELPMQGGPWEQRDTE